MRLIGFLFLFLFVGASVAIAEEVKVGMYVLNVGKYDVGTGLFTADFYLSLICEEDCSNVNFEFSNGRATSIDKIIDTPSEKFYRIQAALSSPPDLRRFPFDSQNMQIIIEDKTSTIEDVRFVVDDETTDLDSDVSFTGWNLDGWAANVDEHVYDVYDETYSRYIFDFTISRIIINSFMKTFLPIIFILLVALTSFLLDPDKLPTRIAMISSGLVASVMFHISITNQIPPVGYLTFADKFMILTYFVILSSFVLNIIMFKLQEKKKHHHVSKLHQSTEYAVFAIVLTVYALFFLLFALKVI